MKRDVHLSILALNSLATFYLAVPVALFVAFWCQPWFSIPILGVMGWVVYRSYKEDNSNNDPGVSFPQSALLLSLLGVAVWVLFSGIGGFWYQSCDFTFRNALFGDILNREWPVVYPDGRYLCYYFAFWLPPAFLGKLMGPFWSGVLLWSWAVLGLFLGYLYLLSGSKKKSVTFGFCMLVLACVPFWAGLDVIAEVLGGIFGFERHDLRYGSNGTGLYFTYNRFVHTLLWTLAICSGKISRRMAVFFSACVLYYNPLGGAAFLIVLVPYYFTKKSAHAENKDEKKIEAAKFSWGDFFNDSFSLEVLLSTVLVVIVGLFLGSNRVVGSEDRMGFQLWYHHYHHYILYVFKAGIPCLFAWRAGRHSPVFWACCAILVFAPFYRVQGGINDFVLSSSFVGLTGALYFFVRSFEMVLPRPGGRKYLYCVYMALAAISPLYIYSDNLFLGIVRKERRVEHTLQRNELRGSIYHSRMKPRYYNAYASPSLLLSGFLFREKNRSNAGTQSEEDEYLPLEDVPFYHDVQDYTRPIVW